MSEAQNGENVMERLTDKAWRNFDPWECCGQDKYCQRGCHDPGGCTKGCIVPRLYARLGAYEDTGLTPEEINDLASVREISPEAEYAINKHADNIIERLDKLLHQTDDDARLRELAEADKDGRLVVLPVRPVLTQSIGSMLYIIEDGEIVEDSLCEALVGMGSNGEINIFYTTLSDQISFEQADIGKTVFLTHEEAKRALEAMKDE